MVAAVPVGNSAEMVSTVLSYLRPNNFNSLGLTCSCCFAYDCSSLIWLFLSSSSGTLAFHLCSWNFASSMISIAVSFHCFASVMSLPPDKISSTYKLQRSRSTLSGYLSDHESSRGWHSRTPPSRNGEGASPNNTCIKW